MALEDLTNQTFNRLTVVEFAGFRGEGKHRRRFWKCRCECGNELELSTGEIKYGSVKSCGCLRADKLREMNTLDEGEAAFRQLFKSYKQKAKERDIQFNLTREEFEEIITKPCYYCGAEPSNVSKSRSSTGDIVYSGVDRLDNNVGYEVGNVVPCCKHCNVAKNNMSMEEFKSMITNIYNHFIRGQ